MILIFSINVHSAELSFFRKSGVSFFKITGVDNNTQIYTKGRYFVAYFPGKLLKKELFDNNLKDQYFKGFYLENTDNSSMIIVECNNGFVPNVKKNGNVIVVKPIPKAAASRRVKRKLIPPPKSMLAMPFYVSENTFSPVEKTKTSYDESLFFSGVRAFYIKNYQLAAAFFREIVTKYPNSSFFISAYFLLGDCYKNMNNYDLAIKTYNKAIELAPKNSAVAQTLFSIAQIYEKKNMFMAARNVYNRIMRDYVGTKWADKASFMLGYSYYLENRCREALKHFLNVQRNDPYYPLSMVLAAECFYRAKFYAKTVLAYYYMSNKLNTVDPVKYYKELGDIGVALCKFEDYKEAGKVFDYLESTHNEEVLEHSYVDRMKCDLKKGDFEDLNYRGKYILKYSKDETLKREARKLMDEAKLKKGEVNRKTIDEIMAKYRNDPEIISLALYVYANKNFRDGNCEGALKYLVKLKKMYPESDYNAKGEGIAAKCINKLIDQFYANPSMDLIEHLFKLSVLLKPKKADMCRLAWGLIFSYRVGEVEKIMHLISDEECRQAVIAKFFIEMGDNLKALDIVNNLQKIEPYVYYINMIFGDVNYFNGDYEKAINLYKNALKIKNKLMDDYLRLRVARAMMQLKEFDKAMDVLKEIRISMYSNDVTFLEGLCLYNKGNYKDAIETFKNLINNLDYKERVLFYLTMSYFKLNDKKDAMKYFGILKRNYPNSEFLRVLKALIL